MTFNDILCSALAKHPLSLLSVASLVIDIAKPDEGPLLKSGRCETQYFDTVLTGLIDVRNRETTALLAVIAELLVNDPVPQLRCRDELAERGGHLPRWITALPQIDVYRAVRRTDVFGDVDEVVLGARLLSGHELTVSVLIDHNMLSGIADGGAVPGAIDEALAEVAETSSDTDDVDMTLADARAWIEDAFTKPTFSPRTDTWPLNRALVEWLIARLPEGGVPRSASGDWDHTEELCDTFFTTNAAAPFTDPGHREVLLGLLETGTGDSLRWSPVRVEDAMRYPHFTNDAIPLEVALDVPDLLRAFIPYAHAQSGIRDELTSRTLAVIDAERLSYKREVLRQANRWEFDDAV